MSTHDLKEGDEVAVCRHGRISHRAKVSKVTPKLLVVEGSKYYRCDGKPSRSSSLSIRVWDRKLEEAALVQSKWEPLRHRLIAASSNVQHFFQHTHTHEDVSVDDVLKKVTELSQVVGLLENFAKTCTVESIRKDKA